MTDVMKAWKCIVKNIIQRTRNRRSRQTVEEKEWVSQPSRWWLGRFRNIAWLQTVNMLYMNHRLPWASGLTGSGGKEYASLNERRGCLEGVKLECSDMIIRSFLPSEVVVFVRRYWPCHMKLFYYLLVAHSTWKWLNQPWIGVERSSGNAEIRRSRNTSVESNERYDVLIVIFHT